MKRTYGAVKYIKDKNIWSIYECEPHVSIRLKQMFPKISITKIPPYDFISNQDICVDLLWFMERYPFKISPSDLSFLKKEKKSFNKNQAELESILLPEWKPNNLLKGLREGCEFRHYQNQAISLFSKVKRLLLVDDIGLGKTYETIGCMLLENTLPAAVVVQTHLQDQWAEKIAEFSHLKTHKIKKTKPYNLPKADVYIFKYSQIAGWTNFFTTSFFKMVAFDEVQELRRGTESNKGQAAKVMVNHAQYVLGTTATPVFNYGIEMFNIMEYIKPGCLGTRYDFIREWCGGSHDGKIVINPEALGSYLKENYLMLRRRKADVYDEVEPVNVIVEKIGHDEKAVKSSEELAKQLAIKSLTGTFVERGQAARELDIRAREMTGTSKAKYVAEFIRMVVESGESVIVAGWHREFYEIILKELNDLNPQMYTGSESQRQKNLAKEAFINGDSKILIISTRSGAGLDGIQYVCSTAIIGELDWSPKVHEQFIGRIDRDGQPNPVMAIYLISDYGSDPVMVNILGLKNSQADGIIDQTTKPKEVMSDKSKLTELAKHFLNKKELLSLEEK